METKRELAEIEARMDTIRAERAEIDRHWGDDAYTSHAERGEALAALARLSREFDSLFEQTPEGKAAAEAVERHGESCANDINRMLLTQTYPQLASQSREHAGPLLKGVAGFLFGLIVIASMNPKIAPVSSGSGDSILASSDKELDTLSNRLAQDMNLDVDVVRERLELESEIHKQQPYTYAAPVR